MRPGTGDVRKESKTLRSRCETGYGSLIQFCGAETELEPVEPKLSLSTRAGAVISYFGSTGFRAEIIFLINILLHILSSVWRMPGLGSSGWAYVHLLYSTAGHRKKKLIFFLKFCRPSKNVKNCNFFFLFFFRMLIFCTVGSLLRIEN